MHTYTRGFARGTHTGRLRVGLATGVEIIPDCLEVGFFSFYEFNIHGFRWKKIFWRKTAFFVTRGGVVKNICRSDNERDYKK